MTGIPGLTSVDRTTSPRKIAVPRHYNAAADFIDCHLAAGRGDRIAVRDDRGSTSYSVLAEKVNRAGNMLKALGVRAEDRVLLLLLDSVEFPALFFGAIKLGAVPVPLNTLLTTDDYGFMLRDIRARVLVVSAPLYEKVAPLLAQASSFEGVVVDGAGAHGRPLLADLMAQASPALAAAATVADDVALWLYNSGSTGQPKAAVHLQSDMVYAR